MPLQPQERPDRQPDVVALRPGRPAPGTAPPRSTASAPGDSSRSPSLLGVAPAASARPSPGRWSPSTQCRRLGATIRKTRTGPNPRRWTTRPAGRDRQLADGRGRPCRSRFTLRLTFSRVSNVQPQVPDRLEVLQAAYQPSNSTHRGAEAARPWPSAASPGSGRSWSARRRPCRRAGSRRGHAVAVGPDQGDQVDARRTTRLCLPDQWRATSSICLA